MSAIMGVLCILLTWFLTSSRRGYAARSPCFPVSLYCWGELLIAVLASRPCIMHGRDANASFINRMCRCSIRWMLHRHMHPSSHQAQDPISRIQGPYPGSRALARALGLGSQGPGPGPWLAGEALLRVNIGYLGPPRGLGPGPRGPF